ncbi:MAG: coproporphyrinogen-III oxidase family protein [Cyanobacteriota bacterium]
MTDFRPIARTGLPPVKPALASWDPGDLPRAAYLHIPFCHRRCFYCDFPVVPLGDRADGAQGSGATSVAAYLALLHQEIALARQGPPLSTVYLGGGTPSLLAPAQVGALLEALQHRFGIAPGAEITLEADPASFDRDRLSGWLAAGINRISLGGQSLDDGVLAALGRRHRRTDVVEAAAWLNGAKGRGALRSWSLDLIQGLPPFSGAMVAGGTLVGATLAADTIVGARAPAEVLADWHQQLQQALALGPPHFSVYDLIVEPGTVFARQQERGQLRLPDEDLGADLMEATAQVLHQAGYGRYEISNYALPGHASRHNRVYWSGTGWWGFGMGATSALGGKRQARPRTRERYAAWIQAGAREGERVVGEEGDGPLGAGPPIDELLSVGLRRREGVPLRQLLAQHGLDSQAESELRLRLAAFEQRGLLRVEGGRWRLQDPQGLALSNAVLREVLEWWQEQRPGAPAGC